MLDQIEELTQVWRGTGMEIGVYPYPWAGTQKAADALAGDLLLHRAVLLLCLGDDADHSGLPGGLTQKLAGRGIEAYALYFGPEDPNDPEIQARDRKFGVSPLLPGFFPRWGES